MEGGRCRGFRRRRCDFECNNGHPAHGQSRGWRKHQNCRECFPGFMFDRNHTNFNIILLIVLLVLVHKHGHSSEPRGLIGTRSGGNESYKLAGAF